jgi:hypothetical protein
LRASIRPDTGHRRGATFAAQPYEQLIYVYRQSVLEADARRVAIAKRNDLRRSGQLTSAGRVGNWILDKRLRGVLPLLRRVIRDLAADTDLWSDPVWLVDSTPVECARSRPAAQRSDLAGFAGYGYCASHSRYFWGLRLHLVCTPAGLPITWALAHPKLECRRTTSCVVGSTA